MAMQIRLEPVLAVLSIILAFGSRYVMLEALTHVLGAQGRDRVRWYVISIVATGVGLWVADMTAFQAIEPGIWDVPPDPLVTYSILALYGLGDVVVSLVLTMMGAWCFVYVMQKHAQARWGVMPCSGVIVLTQTVTQLTGLYALHHPHTVAHHWAPFIALKVFNLFINGLALHFFFKVKPGAAPWDRNKLISAALISLAASAGNVVLIFSTDFDFTPSAPYPGEVVIGVTDVWAAAFAAMSLLLFLVVLVHCHHESLRESQHAITMVEAQRQIDVADLERLKAAQRAKDAFISTLSHELRTPLTIILGYLELLADQVGGTLTDKQKRFVLEMQCTSCRLQNLVNSLLDLASSDADRFVIRRQLCDLAPLVTNEVQNVMPMAQARHIQLSTNVPEHPVMLSLDPERIRQVIGHLLHNAIKFGQEGNTVHIQLAQTSEAVRVTVSDNGPGIAPEHVRHLFEKFFQADAALTRAHGGAGVGLALSKAIINAHGGTISVKSQLGTGSTFWFDLPMPGLAANATA